MVKRLRLKLAVYFALFVLILYELGVLGSVGIFQWGLSRSMDILLQDLLAETRPSVEITNEIPSLSNWAGAAQREHSPVLAIVQIYDPERRLIQHFGPPGIQKLGSGHFFSKDKSISVRSLYQPIIHQGKSYGFLQIQVSTASDDKIFNDMLLATFLVVPFLALGVVVAGYQFAGIALRPVEETLDLFKRFVADAGHELKTPISVIEAATETLSAVQNKKKIEKSDLEFELETISKANRRMKELTSDLLFLARVEDQAIVFRRREIEMSELIEEVLDQFRPLAKSKNLELAAQTDTQVKVVGEPESIHQLISNLISNAIRYSDQGKILVRLSESDTCAVIEVSDTGIGISDEDKDNIFHRFHRSEESRTREAGGAGLGLSIVKAVVEAHKGSISVDSELGQGSTFTVRLPKKLA